MKNIVFRVDSSSIIGSGHLMRCLTLAEEFKKNRNIATKIYFISRRHQGNLNKIILEKKFQLIEMPLAKKKVKEDGLNYGINWLGVSQKKDADDFILAANEIKINLLIIDHYGLDEKWEVIVKPHVKKMMVIDDLANRNHICDYLLDQNYYDKLESRYEYLVPYNCKLFLGPKFIILRDEFIKIRKKINHNTKNRILIFFGAIDQYNLSLMALKALLLNREEKFNVDLVIGQKNPHKYLIKDYVKDYVNITLHIQIDNLSEIMSKALIFIGAGGTAIWEACFLGIPSFIISFADNQISSVMHLDKMNFIKYIGHYNDIDIIELNKHIFKFLNDSNKLKALSKKNLKLLDGFGKNRILNELSYD